MCGPRRGRVSQGRPAKSAGALSEVDDQEEIKQQIADVRRIRQSALRNVVQEQGDDLWNLGWCLDIRDAGPGQWIRITSTTRGFVSSQRQSREKEGNSQLGVVKTAVDPGMRKEQDQQKVKHEKKNTN